MWNLDEEFPELAADAAADPDSSSARLLKMLRTADAALDADDLNKNEVKFRN